MSNDAPAAPGEDDTPAAVAESHGTPKRRDLGAEEKGRGRPTPNPPQSAPAAKHINRYLGAHVEVTYTDAAGHVWTLS
jgi:hypothetical protein